MDLRTLPVFSEEITHKGDKHDGSGAVKVDINTHQSLGTMFEMYGL